jgi:hypothetical protein
VGHLEHPRGNGSLIPEFLQVCKHPDESLLYYFFRFLRVIEYAKRGIVQSVLIPIHQCLEASCFPGSAKLVNEGLIAKVHIYLQRLPEKGDTITTSNAPRQFNAKAIISSI